MPQGIAPHELGALTLPSQLEEGEIDTERLQVPAAVASRSALRAVCTR